MAIYLWGYLVIINLFTFILYGIDKWKAKRQKWRIPETTLLLWAVAGGALGACGAMQAFRHKTQHKKFTILVPLMLLTWVVGLTYLFTK